MRFSSAHFTAAVYYGSSCAHGWSIALRMPTLGHAVSAAGTKTKFATFTRTTNGDNNAPETDTDSCLEAASERTKLRIYYNDVYEVPLPKNHRFPMEKYRLVRELVKKTIQRLSAKDDIANSPTSTPDVEFMVSPLASQEDLQTTHDANYVQRFLDGDMTPQEERNVGFPWSIDSVRRSLSSVGGTLEAALYVCSELKKNRKNRESYTPVWAAHIAGGTHHAFFNYGEGFSVFSDIAVAANVVLQRYPETVQRILIVDLDVHQGNGNAVLFQQQPNVFTFSMHCSGNYFSKKEESDLDIELPIGCNDSTYLMTLHHWLKQFQQQHESGQFVVDLIFFQAGVDVLEADRLGRLHLSTQGVHRRNELVYRFADRLRVPCVITMGGGYPKQISSDGPDSKSGWEDIIGSHASVYIQAFQFLEEWSTKDKS